MAVETEVKLLLSDIHDFRNKVTSLKPAVVSSRHFEDNFVLDFPDGRLRAQACLLRIRKTDAGASVTFKGPPQASPLFKSREEWETRVADAETMLKVFEKMGMAIWFRYQKYREEYSISSEGKPGMEVHLAVDSTPIGDYAEIEGPEEGIREVALKLGFPESQYVRESYYALYAQSCRRRVERPGNMVYAARGPGGTAPT